MKLKHIVLGGILCLAVLPVLAVATGMDSLCTLLNSPAGQVWAKACIKGSVDTRVAAGAVCLSQGM